MIVQKGSAKGTAKGMFSSPITVAIILYAFGPIMFSVLPVAVGAFTHYLCNDRQLHREAIRLQYQEGRAPGCSE